MEIRGGAESERVARTSDIQAAAGLTVRLRSVEDELHYLPGSLNHRALHDVAPDDENVHLRAEEAVERFPGTKHDGLVFVERRIEEDRHAADALEGLDEIPVAGIRPAAHRL